jgi:hypothetical protein
MTVADSTGWWQMPPEVVSQTHDMTHPWDDTRQQTSIVQSK